MSKRAKFETNKGLVTISRGVLTVSQGKTGRTESYTTAGNVRPVTAPGETLSVDVYGGRTLHFKVLKTPAMMRAESLKAFIPQELSRLQNLGDDAAVAAFRSKYSSYFSKESKKANRKEA